MCQIALSVGLGHSAFNKTTMLPSSG